MSLWENSARVPLIIYDPQSKGKGRHCGRTVELIDLHPTLADLCDLPVPSNLDGKRLRPLLRDPRAAWEKPAYTQVTRGGGMGANAQQRFMGRSVRTERWRYTEWADGQRGVQLHDMKNDPRELTNLAEDPRHQATAQEMQRLLRGTTQSRSGRLSRGGI